MSLFARRGLTLLMSTAVTILGAVTAVSADGYGMAAENISADRTSAGHGESFSVSATVKNIGSGKFPGGQFAAALADGRGGVAEIVGVESHFKAIGPSENISVNIRCSIADDVAPGQYLLTVVVRAKGKAWEPASGGGVDGAVRFSVTGRSSGNLGTAGGGDRYKQTPAAAQTPETAPAPAPVQAAAKEEPSGRAGNETGDWDIKKLDVARNVSYLTEAEKDVILELNMARSNPKKYAELYIQPMLKYYNGNRYSEPGKTTLVSQEGASAAQECIAELSQTKGIGILTPEKGLHLAAKDHAADQGRTGESGHVGSDGSKMGDRVNRYCDAKRSALGENISYGKNTGREIVLQLLIDDGVPSRGHRKIIMNGAYTQVGLSIGTHPKYGYLCVIDYANGYTSR
ncbi:hypothetical protein R80B4_01460 [Fibrobacteres bacterium R8-0-B4]